MPSGTSFPSTSVASHSSECAPCWERVAPVTASTVLPPEAAFHFTRYLLRFTAHLSSVFTNRFCSLVIQTAPTFLGAYSPSNVTVVNSTVNLGPVGCGPVPVLPTVGSPLPDDAMVVLGSPPPVVV